MEDYRRFLDPRVLAKVSRLEIRARLVVEGYISGLHRSPYRGFSVEFAEHREYVPGDDIRHIDWKVYGRSDRYYVKEYEEETNLRAHILLDASESMQYGGDGDGGMSKLAYASTIAATLSYLVLNQQDAVGLVLFDTDVRNVIPPSSNPTHLRYIVEALEGAGGAEKTDVGATLRAVADRVKKKGIVVLISDMLDDIERVRKGLRYLRHKHHDIILFHVLDHDEVTFPFQRMTMFEGMEAYPNLLANPRALRNAYLREVAEFLAELKRACRGERIDYVGVDTSTKLDVVLTSYLAARSRRKR